MARQAAVKVMIPRVLTLDGFETVERFSSLGGLFEGALAHATVE